MDYFSIPNLKQYQHYSQDRKPIWIKLYASTLTDPTFMLLPDSSKGHLMLLWSLASTNRNLLPYCPRAIKKLIGSSSPVNLDLFVNKGLIIKLSSKMLEAHHNGVYNHKIREDKIREDKSKPLRQNKIYSDEDMVLAKYFFTTIQTNSPNAKPPLFNSWAEEIRFMRKIDKRDPADIRKLWDWASGDNFWRSNILSPVKLRKQWTQLELKQREHLNGGRRDGHGNGRTKSGLCY